MFLTIKNQAKPFFFSSQPAADKDDSKEDNTLDDESVDQSSDFGHVVINAHQTHLFVASGFKGEGDSFRLGYFSFF